MDQENLEKRISEYTAYSTLVDVIGRVNLLGPNAAHIHEKANVLAVLVYESDNLEEEGLRYISFSEYRERDSQGYARAVGSLVKAIKMGACV